MSPSISSQTDFLVYFQKLEERNVVLLFDEFSELFRAPPHIRDELLRTFRGIRSHPVGYAICSIMAAGTFSILDLNPTDNRISPFNISDQVANPYFCLNETKELFSLFAKDNDIIIDDEVVEDIWFKSNGCVAQFPRSMGAENSLQSSGNGLPMWAYDFQILEIAARPRFEDCVNSKVETIPHSETAPRDLFVSNIRFHD